MADNLFSRLGFRTQKPKVSVTVPDEIEKELNEQREKRKSRSKNDSLATAQLYAEILPAPFIKELMKHNDFHCLQWGSRKVARLCNLCRNILDVEIITSERPLEEKDRRHVLTLLVWMCWLIPIPIKNYLRRPDVNEHFEPLMKDWLTKQFEMATEDEAKLVLAGVFEGQSTRPGNPVLDIFHDALRFEDAQFGNNIDISLMRTELGKNEVFKTKAQKDSHQNLTPHWLFYFQEQQGITGLVDKKRALDDEEYLEKDGISG